MRGAPSGAAWRLPLLAASRRYLHGRATLMRPAGSGVKDARAADGHARAADGATPPPPFTSLSQGRRGSDAIKAFRALTRGA